MNDHGENKAVAGDRVRRSMEIYRRALQLIPGGTQLVSRRPTRFAFGVSPIYAARAKGARFWDVDGNEYIDWVSGVGSIILGYADPIIDDAVCRQIATGTIYSVNHALEVELAEELVKLVPCAEMVRFAKGGGEACAIAVRIARGVTGRDIVLFCGYHGWHDWYLAANLSRDSALDAHLFPGIGPVGVPRGLRDTAIPFRYGDLEDLQRTLDEHRGRVAAVILEPLRSETPPDEYLAGVARLTRDFQAVLIFDEVSTGFRPSAAGIQPEVGVTPDMAVFAKSISNGYPLGVVVGRRDVMEPAAKMFISSTYWSDTIGLRAALTTLREIRRRDAPAHCRQLGENLQRHLNRIAADTELPIVCDGVSFHPTLRFEIPAGEFPAGELETKMATLYIQEMAKRGCHGYPSFYLNTAQGAAELDETLDAIREVFPLMSDALRGRRVDALLECQPQTEVFRRLVR